MHEDLSLFLNIRTEASKVNFFFGMAEAPNKGIKDIVQSLNETAVGNGRSSSESAVVGLLSVTPFLASSVCLP